MLSDLDTATLDFERQRWRYLGAKEAAIRDTFDESPVRFYQRLGSLLDRPDALAYDPVLVRRLVRLRDVRREARGSRRAG